MNKQKRHVDNEEYFRLDEPVIEYWYVEGIDNRYKARYQEDKLHCLDGPAVEHLNGTKEWYINGENFTEKEFNKRINRM